MAKETQAGPQKPASTIRVHLDRAYVYRGVTYGPGPADVPEEVQATDALGQPAGTHSPPDDLREAVARSQARDRAAGRVAHPGGDDMQYVKRPEGAPLPAEPGLPVGLPGRAPVTESGAPPKK